MHFWVSKREFVKERLIWINLNKIEGKGNRYISDIGFWLLSMGICVYIDR